MSSGQEAYHGATACRLGVTTRMSWLGTKKASLLLLKRNSHRSVTKVSACTLLMTCQDILEAVLVSKYMKILPKLNMI